MARTTQRHRVYEVDKMGWISVYPIVVAQKKGILIVVAQKKGILNNIITRLKGALKRLTLVVR